MRRRLAPTPDFLTRSTARSEWKTYDHPFVPADTVCEHITEEVTIAEQRRVDSLLQLSKKHNINAVLAVHAYSGTPLPYKEIRCLNCNRYVNEMVINAWFELLQRRNDAYMASSFHSTRQADLNQSVDAHFCTYSQSAPNSHNKILQPLR